MAINFLNDVSFNKNEIIQPVLENQTGDVAAGTPVDGQLYYDTTNNQVKYGEGGSWIALTTGGGDLTEIQTTTSNQLTITNGTGPIPSLAIVTGAVANNGTALATGDQIYDFVIGQLPTVNNNTITLTMGDGLSSSSGSFTLNQNSDEEFTFTVGAGTGIQVNSGNVAIDYVGADNAVLSASTARIFTVNVYPFTPKSSALASSLLFLSYAIATI